jgi:hypothetical protein
MLYLESIFLASLEVKAGSFIHYLKTTSEVILVHYLPEPTIRYKELKHAICRIRPRARDQNGMNYVC